MAPRSLVCVVTTIQAPTPCVTHLAETLCRTGGSLIVIGDRKGPTHFELPGARFWPLEAQQALPFELARILPTNHYARKNLGYLLALREGAECLYETDDDNRPGAGWKPRDLTTAARSVAPQPWCNVYRAYSKQHIWPRGLPLERLGDPAPAFANGDAQLQCVAPIQQGLADVAPDVDAVWRMVFGQEVQFDPGPSLSLPPGTWCPFNSQSTWWWPVAFPLLYLPCHCSFRMTDIWRSFVAQRCLWSLGHNLVFHGPEVIQERNQHRLLRDFEDEVPGYLQNQKIVDTLGKLDLAPGAGSVSLNLHRCYEALIAAGFLPHEEGPLLQAWINDVQFCRASPAGRAHAA